MNNYDYWIETKALDPPLGENRFFAKVKFTYKTSTLEKSDKIVNYNFGETYGKTEEEAKQEMEEKVNKWIKTN